MGRVCKRRAAFAFSIASAVARDHLRLAHDAAARKAPASLQQHAHAEPGREGGVEMLQLVLARVGGFILVAADADVGVAGARFLARAAARFPRGWFGNECRGFRMLGAIGKRSPVRSSLTSGAGFGDEGVRGQAFLRVGSKAAAPVFSRSYARQVGLGILMLPSPATPKQSRPCGGFRTPARTCAATSEAGNPTVNLRTMQKKSLRRNRGAVPVVRFYQQRKDGQSGIAAAPVADQERSRS